MEKPKHIQLFEELEKEGVGYATDISAWLAHNYKLYNTEKEYTKEVKAMFNFMNSLCHKNYIQWDADVDGTVYRYYPRYNASLSVQRWFNSTDGFKNMVYLTSDGFDYLENYRERKVNEGLILSTKSANSYIKSNFYASIIFSVVTLIFIGLNVHISNKNYDLSLSNAKSDSLESIATMKRLDTLESILHSLKEEVRLSKKVQTSPKRGHP